MTSRWRHRESYMWRYWRNIEPWPRLKVARNDKYAILWFIKKFFPASFNECIFTRKISFLSDSPIFPTRFGLKNRRGAFSSFLMTCHWWYCNLGVRGVWWSFIWTEFFRGDQMLQSIKCGASSRWSFRPNSARGSKKTTIRKTHPTLESHFKRNF